MLRISPPWLCKAFGDKTPDERSKIITDNKLCPFCLLHSSEEVCYSKTYKTKPIFLELGCKEQHIKWLHDVLKELPCLKGEKECKVNMVQGQDGWRTLEDKWMDMEEAEREVFFVNVLYGTGLDSDEELEREIEKTEADMDACILRRAKRAGVIVAEPEGRHMSKEERDCICKKIGNEPGALSQEKERNRGDE